MNSSLFCLNTFISCYFTPWLSTKLLCLGDVAHCSIFIQAPAKFSELQIQSYLKTVAFRREIDEVQKSAAGRGLGGVQTSRIASEANREYIFSSSFTGDKELVIFNMLSVT